MKTITAKTITAKIGGEELTRAMSEAARVIDGTKGARERISGGALFIGGEGVKENRKAKRSEARERAAPFSAKVAKVAAEFESRADELRAELAAVNAAKIAAINANGEACRAKSAERAIITFGNMAAYNDERAVFGLPLEIKTASVKVAIKNYDELAKYL